MKNARFIFSIIIACLIISISPSATALAQENTSTAITTTANGDHDIPKIAYVTVTNNTGGILYIELKAMQYAHEPQRRSYAFGFPNQGKIRFQILPGRYTITVRSSNCGGKKMYTKFFTAETTIGIYSCDKKGQR